MPEPPQSAEVVSLAERLKDRKAKSSTDFLEDPGAIEPAIDLLDEVDVSFTASAVRGGNPQQDTLGVVMHQGGGGDVHKLGALWLTREQWVGLRKVANRVLNALEKPRPKRPSKTPRRP